MWARAAWAASVCLSLGCPNSDDGPAIKIGTNAPDFASVFENVLIRKGGRIADFAPNPYGLCSLPDRLYRCFGQRGANDIHLICDSWAHYRILAGSNLFGRLDSLVEHCNHRPWREFVGRGLAAVLEL